MNNLFQKEIAKEAVHNNSVISPFNEKNEFFVEPLGEIPGKPVYRFFKRIFDIFASGAALIVLCIPMLFIAIAIKCVSAGTVFYSQERLGLNGKKIQILKFRTMNMDAEANGAQWSVGESDPRIFPLGRTLRKYHIDEIPQFWCILRGDLSLVGPRPERECFYKEFETYVHGFSERLKVKPGLTGLAQISGGYDLKPEEKIMYDVEYIKTRSFRLDILIMLKTLKVLFTRDSTK